MPFSYSTAECANANANLFNSRYRLQARVASPCRSSSTHQASHLSVCELAGKLRPVSNILYLRVAKQMSKMAEMKYERSGWQPRWKSIKNPSKNTIFQAMITLLKRHFLFLFHPQNLLRVPRLAKSEKAQHVLGNWKHWSCIQIHHFLASCLDGAVWQPGEAHLFKCFCLLFRQRPSL